MTMNNMSNTTPPAAAAPMITGVPTWLRLPSSPPNEKAYIHDSQYNNLRLNEGHGGNDQSRPS